MELDIDNIDFYALRNDLIDYFGTASFAYQMAVADVVEVENASDIELLNIIQKTSLDITDYIKKDLSR